MKTQKLLRSLSLLLVTGFVLVLAACGNDDAGSGAEDAVAEDVYVDVYQDLQDARQAVAENLDWGDHMWEQIMLADDVPGPEMKYGLLVVPFFPSDLVQRHTRTVDIDGAGNFVIEVISAETGYTWTINQDGVIGGGN